MLNRLFSAGCTYPPPDDTVRDYMTADCDSYSRLCVSYDIYFHFLFLTVEARLELFDPGKFSYNGLAPAWRSYLRAGFNRSALYAEIVNNANKVRSRTYYVSYSPELLDLPVARRSPAGVCSC